jgi:hypothetical protein
METYRRPGFILEKPLGNDTDWATAATIGTLTTFHVDDGGFATGITMLSGKKWWIVCRQKRGMVGGGPGDLASINAFPKTWPSYDDISDRWEMEGVLLVPGDVL